MSVGCCWTVKRVLPGFRRWLCVCIAVWLVLRALTGFASADTVEDANEEPITVTFSIREYITDSYYFERIPMAVEQPATFAALLESCVQSGYLDGYLFDESGLQTLHFVNGTSLSVGDYGEKSGFQMIHSGRRLATLENLHLRDAREYVLMYKADPSNPIPCLSRNAVTGDSVWKWNDSWEATMDSACDWLYNNRMRGSYDAITALGVAKRSANPTDVVLLTQMVDVNTGQLDSLIHLLYAAAYCGYSHPTLDGRDLFYQLQNYCAVQLCSTTQLCAILQLYDGLEFTVSDDVRLSRKAIVQELLKRQKPDGGFAQRQSSNAGISITAQALTVLVPYRDLYVVDKAVQNGVSFLSAPDVRDKLFSSDPNVECTTIAQMVIAMCSCRLPMYDVYFTKDGLTYADLLLRYMRVSGGFAQTVGQAESESATAAAIIAMRALQQMDNPYVDEMPLVQLVVQTEDFEQEAVMTDTVPAEKPRESKLLQFKSGFWLAFSCTVGLILLEIWHYCRHRKMYRMTHVAQDKDNDQKGEDNA